MNVYEGIDCTNSIAELNKLLCSNPLINQFLKRIDGTLEQQRCSLKEQMKKLRETHLDNLNIFIDMDKNLCASYNQYFIGMLIKDNKIILDYVQANKELNIVSREIYNNEGKLAGIQANKLPPQLFPYEPNARLEGHSLEHTQTNPSILNQFNQSTTAVHRNIYSRLSKRYGFN
jgi:hypothetical protein